jgi:hypothetical protein
MNQDGMQNAMTMMEQMQRHHDVIYTFGGLVILGFVIVIILQCLMLKELRKKRG